MTRTSPQSVEKLRELFADGYQPTVREAGQALGLSRQALHRLATKTGVSFRRLTAEEFSAATVEGIKARAAKAPAAATSNVVPVERDATDVMHRVRRPESGRFYLRHPKTLQFVHQCLEPAKDGRGPMMTGDRRYGWFDSIERYRGAKRRWPELAEMRKEVVGK